MNKDSQFLQEAYIAILEKKTKMKGGWVPPWIKDKKDSEKESKKDSEKESKKDSEKESKKDDKKNKKPALKKEKKGALEEAYLEVFESKHINKKFAKKYNKITSQLLKADPSSKDYASLKSQRDDLVKILSDHGMTPADLDELLTKTEKDELEPMEPKEQHDVPQTCTQCGDGHSKDKCPENCW
jgi:hypothetical protein